MSDTREMLQKIDERLTELCLQARQGVRSHNSENIRLSHQMFEIGEVVQILVDIVAAQQAELVLMREQLRHLGIR